MEHKISRKKIILSWLKFRFRLLISIMGLSLLFIVLSMLYHINISPSLYGAFLSLFITFLWCILDFYKFIRKIRQVEEARLNFKIALSPLPEADHLIEELYKNFIEDLYEDRLEIISETEKEKSNREDYYTLWVHQIKTPIAALGLLLRSDHVEENTFFMEQELFKIEQYAEMVLQYIRLESLSFDLILKEYAIYEIIKQSVKKYAYSFIGKKLSLNLEEFKLKAVTDEKWLSFILEQLLSNCIKYTAEGEIKIGLAADNSRTVIISDTGIGIKPEDLSRIFDRGFTGYNGRMDKTSTGIGLYLCEKVAYKLSIELSVSSKVNEGTTYRIYFPPYPGTLQK